MCSTLWGMPAVGCPRYGLWTELLGAVQPQGFWANFPDHPGACFFAGMVVGMVVALWIKK